MITITQATWIRERSKRWREADRTLPDAWAHWIALRELEEEGHPFSEDELADWVAFAWRQDRRNAEINQQLPQSVVDRFLVTLSMQDRAFHRIQGDDDVIWKACSWWYLQHNHQEAEHLCLPQTRTIGAHDPYVIVEWAEGLEAGAALAEKYGFSRLSATMPDTFWHCLDSRQQGSAIIAFYGDDRGHSPTYTVIITWAPQILMACYVQPVVPS